MGLEVDGTIGLEALAVVRDAVAALTDDEVLLIMES
jgi:hypothetical protein